MGGFGAGDGVGPYKVRFRAAAPLALETGKGCRRVLSIQDHESRVEVGRIAHPQQIRHE